MRLLVSLYMWAAWLIVGTLGIFVMLTAMVLLPRRKAYAVIRPTVTFCLGVSGVKVVARGLEKFKYDRPFIIMANHVNLLDPFFYAVVLPVPYNGVEKKENFRVPIYGWLMGKWGNVPIDRNNLERAKQDLEIAARVMHEENMWTIVMPEGTRTRDGYILPFKKGGFHMSLVTGVPIVPVTMNGASDIQVRGSFWAKPGTIELIWGDPIDPANYSLETIDDFIRDVRAAVVGPYTGPKSEQDLLGVAPQTTPATS